MQIGSLVKKTFVAWLGGSVFERSAALAYTTLFSIGPTLLIIIGLIGLVLGRETAEGRIFSEMEIMLGPYAAEAVRSVIAHVAFEKGDALALVMGLVLFLFGVTAVLSQLKSSLNEIWMVGPAPDANNVVNFLKNRLLSLALLIVFGFLLLVSLLLSVGLTAFGDMISSYLSMPEWVLATFNAVFSFAVITFFFMLLFKVIPDVALGWKSVWAGAVLTSIFFSIGKYLIALYLAKSSVASVFGAAGSIVVVLVWVYYSSLILFLGAVFVRVLAEEKGVNAVPMKGYVRFQKIVAG